MHNLRVDLRRISSSPTLRLLGNLPRGPIEIELEIEIELGTGVGIGIGQRRWRRGRYYPVQLARPKAAARERTMAITTVITTMTTTSAAGGAAAAAGGGAAAAAAMAFGMWAPLTRAYPPARCL